MWILNLITMVLSTGPTAGHGSDQETFDYITDILEHQTWTSSGWTDNTLSSFSTQYVCTEIQVGPFLGGFTDSFSKTFSLDPHFYVQISLDILYTQYWQPGDTFTISVDGVQKFQQTNLDTSSLFELPFDYCKSNIQASSQQLKQKLETVYIELDHQSQFLTLDFTGLGNCGTVNTESVCNMVAIKNLLIQISKCHQTCKGCQGADKTDCLTCPTRTLAVNGECTCSPQYSHNYFCVPSCPTYYIPSNGECVLQCADQCKTCNGNQCSQCEAGLILLNGQCYTICPTWAPSCVDYSTLTTPSTYLGKLLTTLNMYELKQKFTYSLSSYTNQIYSIYDKKLILGGFGVWAGNGVGTGVSMSLSFTVLPPHYQIRIYFTAYFIDLWNGERLIVNDESSTYVDMPMIMGATNSMYRDQNDVVQVVSGVMPHSATTVTFRFQITLATQAFEGSLGITDLYILTDNCGSYCNLCTSTACTECQLTKNLIHGQCIICGTTYNRNTDCSCQTGFYDNISTTCDTCPPSCSGGCSGPLGCISCAAPYNTPPACQNCDNGYYFTRGICSKCDASCYSCTNGLSCTTCLTGLISLASGLCGTCGIGKFVSLNICQQCSNQCLTCQNSASQCTNCAVYRSGAPICNCTSGYFQDLSNNCQQCSIKCALCANNADNCISCSANRSNPPLCSCGSGAVEVPNVAFCSTCDITVAQIRFSDDLNQILVEFNLQIYQFQDCFSLIGNLSSLGSNPKCTLQSSSLIITLGQNANITVGDSIPFNNLKIFNCSGFSTVINNYVQRPLNYINPQIIFKQSNIQLLFCQGYNVTIQNLTINGQRSFKSLVWGSQNSSVVGLLTDWNQLPLNTNQFYIPAGIFAAGQTIILTATFSNFLNQFGQSGLQITIINQAYSTIQVPTSPYNYISNTIIVRLFDQNCQVNGAQTFPIQVNVSQENFLQQYDGLMVDNIYSFTIPPNTLQPGLNYQINTLVIQQNNITKQNYLFIINGDRQVGFRESFTIYANSSLKTNYNWGCINLLTKLPCNITFNQTQSQYIPAYTFNGFQLVQFTVKQDQLSAQAIISTTEANLPQLDIIMDYSNRINNYYDELYFKLIYPSSINPDELFYYIQVQWGSNSTIFRVYFNEFKFKLWEQIPIYTFDQIIVKISVFNPLYLVPSTASQTIMMNIPPQYCNILQQNDIFVVQNCWDINQPMQYLFCYYGNETDYNSDNLEGHVFKGIILQNFSIDNQIIFYVPNNNTKILVQIKDNFEGITNLTILVNASNSKVNLSDIINQSPQQQYVTIMNALLSQKLDNQSIQIIQEFANNPNLTYLQQIQIKQQLFNITSQINITNEYQLIENQIQTTINQYSKLFEFNNNYLDEIKKLTQRSYITKLANYLSFLYDVKVNNQTSRRRRLLITSNNTVDLVTTIQNGLISGQLVNGPQETINTLQFNITTNVLSQSQFDGTFNSSNTYNQSLQVYAINPYQNDSNFEFSQPKETPLYIPNVTQNGQLYQNQSINLSFPKPKNIAAVQCASQIQNYWTTDVCQPEEQANQIICVCREISPTTIVQILENLSTSVSSVFTPKAINNINNLSVGELVFFYIILFYSIGYFIALYYGYKLDQDQISPKTEQQKVHPIDEERQQLDIPLNTTKQNYSKLNSKLYKPLPSQTEIVISEEQQKQSTTTRRMTQKLTQLQQVKEELGIDDDQDDNKIEEQQNLKINIEKQISDQQNSVQQISEQDEDVQKQKDIKENQEIEAQKEKNDSLLAEQQGDQNENQSSKSQNNMKSPASIQANQSINSIDEKDIGVHQKVKQGTITHYYGFYLFVRNWHQLLCIYFRYDNESTRIHRTTIVYISLLGQICIITVFGKILGLSTLIALAIFQSIFSFIFQKFISYLLNHQNKYFKYSGGVISVSCAGLFYFMILASVSLYENEHTANIWAAEYIGSFIIDYCINRNITLGIFYLITMYFYEDERVKKLVDIVLDIKMIEFLLGKNI
ncbi:hypothetical protein pb186bvf_012219 [Paramecium bursaria]